MYDEWRDMSYIIDCEGCPANIFRFGPPSIFDGKLVETNFKIIGQDVPLRIFIVAGPEEFARKNPFFWTLGKIRKLDDSVSPPGIIKGSGRELIKEYKRILDTYNPMPII
jgi:hypothetical protein